MKIGNRLFHFADDLIDEAMSLSILPHGADDSDDPHSLLAAPFSHQPKKKAIVQ